MADSLPIHNAEIRTLIPHSGSMCLLDSVTQWDDRSIVCVTNTHRDPANPSSRSRNFSLDFDITAAAMFKESLFRRDAETNTRDAHHITIPPSTQSTWPVM